MQAPHSNLVSTVGLVYLAGSLFWRIWTVETNPYLSIPERNPFGLTTPARKVQEKTEVPRSERSGATIKLTGITSVLNPSKALIEITDLGSERTVRRLILSQGERNGDLETLSINVEKSEVTVRNHGAITHITFAPTQTAKVALPPKGGAERRNPLAPLPPSRGRTATSETK
jgi:hypothetical protein